MSVQHTTVSHSLHVHSEEGVGAPGVLAAVAEALVSLLSETTAPGSQHAPYLPPKQGAGSMGFVGHSPWEGGRDCGPFHPLPYPSASTHLPRQEARLRSCWKERNCVDTSESQRPPWASPGNV